MIQYWFERHREVQKRRSEEGFEGFTLIELLIVIVVLGILAAIVIFALGGITGNSAQAACNTDAKSVETAADAYKASPDNTTGAWPTSMADLTSTGGASLANANGKKDVFLQIVPNNPAHYKITTAGGVVTVTPKGGTAAPYDSGASNPCSKVQ